MCIRDSPWKNGGKFLKIIFTHEKLEAKSWKYFSPMKKMEANSWQYFSLMKKLEANSWKYVSPMKKMEADSWKYFSPMKKWRQNPKKYVSPMTNWRQIPNHMCGTQKIQKIKILKIKIRSAQNVGKVWISRKKSSWPHLGPSGPIFCVGRKNRKIDVSVFFGGPMGPIHPVWGPCCYPPEVGQ